MSWMLEGRHLNSILITRLRYLGDVVMATPLLEVLRRGAPEVRLGFLAEHPHGLVLEGNPYLDRLHLLATKRRGRDARARAEHSGTIGVTALSSWEMVSHLRSCQYDLAVDLFFNPRSAWLLRLSGIDLRVAGTRGSRRFLYSHNIIPSQSPERFQGLFNSARGGLGEHLARLAPLVHIESGLGFLDWFQKEFGSSALRPQLPRGFWSNKAPQQLFGLEKFLDEQPVVLAPGATWATKEWPLDHWKKLIQQLLSQTHRPLLIIQPPGDSEKWTSLGAEIPKSRGGLLQVLSLSQVLGIISRAALLISVDGGVMHSGVGLGVPTVALFGPTDPNLWFPYENTGPFRVLNIKAPCAPCNLHECGQFICLPDLKPDQVLPACLELLLEG